MPFSGLINSLARDLAELILGWTILLHGTADTGYQSHQE